MLFTVLMLGCASPEKPSPTPVETVPDITSIVETTPTEETTSVGGAGQTFLSGSYTNVITVRAPDVVIRGISLVGDEVNGNGGAITMAEEA